MTILAFGYHFITKTKKKKRNLECMYELHFSIGHFLPSCKSQVPMISEGKGQLSAMRGGQTASNYSFPLKEFRNLREQTKAELWKQLLPREFWLERKGSRRKCFQKDADSMKEQLRKKDLKSQGQEGSGGKKGGGRTWKS